MPIKPGTMTAKGQETRQRIVAAAAQLMFERGVANTTIEDVRAAAQVSNSQVYHYFADKTALVRAVIEYQTDAVIEPQEQLFARLDTMAGLREWRNFAVARQRDRTGRDGSGDRAGDHRVPLPARHPMPLLDSRKRSQGVTFW
ncbi:TetR/AcrR family transcriptional regulator [Nonomuraea jiangxiensis]|uniref:Regulatory protein, tetR family n=1 Tax=Nonomuraea jiangxiensis TaxID=633440 RepID=A0A1G9RQ96_9ACTN|nr:TetR family transcriptional regulator [Nonomuraea jiangxiensis]SDM25519.1 regulatory protein, tetR family [Nonomuraea jiangxiensis]